ncbi:MAG: F0F1 ATP synthase subunit delta [Oceanipulchritudo sp.]
MAGEKDIKVAKRLARLIVDAGEERIGELKPALESILQGRSRADRKAFLKAFHRAVARECHKDTLIIESAEPLAPETRKNLVASFSEGHERILQVEERITPGLIAGIRVRLGDTVYDSSLSYRLDSLASRIH